LKPPRPRDKEGMIPGRAMRASVLAPSLVTLALSGPALAAGASGSTDDAPAASPSDEWNVLLLTVDALRADRMGLYGHDRDTTPYLERLADESVVFEQCYANGAWTSPGIVSMLTGLYPPAHGQGTRYDYVDKGIDTPLDVLVREHGFLTIARDTDSPTYRGVGLQWSYLPARRDPLDVMDWLADLDHRWLAWVHIKPTHLPYDPPAYHLRRFGGDRLDTPAIQAVRSSGTVYPRDYGLSWDPPVIAEFTPQEQAVVRDLYDGEVAHADDLVGRMIETLRERGQLDRTIVIISADHGEELFEHGWVGHASTGYQGKVTDELLHIPLIVRLPGGHTTGRVQALVQQHDVMPTLFELLGADASRVDGGFQGHSLLPLMQGQQGATGHEHVFARTTFRGWTTPLDQADDGATAVRDSGRKLIRLRRDGQISHQAFDLATDPGEQQDLWPTESERFADLAQALDAWEAENVDKGAELLFAAAAHRMESLEEAARERDPVVAAEEWLGLLELERTYANEWHPPMADRRYQGKWTRLKRRAAPQRDRAGR